MSLIAKFMVVLSLIWVVFCVWLCWPFKESADIYICVVANAPVILGWIIRTGFHFCSNKNPPTKGAETKGQFLLPAGATFKNPARLTKRLTVFIVIECLLLFLSCFLKIVKPHFVSSFGSGIFALILFGNIMVLGLIIFPLLRIAMNFKWIYQTNFNTHQLGRSNLSYSPKSAAGWSMVPLLVYYPMKEICKSNWYTRDQWRNQPSPILFKLWWTVILSSVFVKILFSTFCKTYHSLGEILFYSSILISRILYIILINKIAKKQIQTHESVNREIS